MRLGQASALPDIPATWLDRHTKVSDAGGKSSLSNKAQRSRIGEGVIMYAASTPTIAYLQAESLQELQQIATSSRAIAASQAKLRQDMQQLKKL